MILFQTVSLTSAGVSTEAATKLPFIAETNIRSKKIESVRLKKSNNSNLIIFNKKFDEILIDLKESKIKKYDTQQNT